MIKKKKATFWIFSVLIIYIFIFSDIGIISKMRLDKKIKNFESQMEKISIENELLKINIERLKTDYDFIAEQARKFGYARSGEKIFRFYETKATNNIINQTNVHRFTLNKLKFKDYLIYIITFIVVVAIYLVLLYTNK